MSGILEVRDLEKRYGGVRAVDNVSFDLHQGEVLTLLGPSGCGKSTTLRLVAGLEEPDGGEIRLHGRVVASVSKRVFLAAEKRNLGLVFQSYAVWPHMTVAQNVAYPLELRRVPRADIRSRVDAVLQLVGLGGLGDRPATALSGGQQQRVSLARAIV
jgi:iron(III) transport system ATP-binding protein